MLSRSEILISKFKNLNSFSARKNAYSLEAHFKNLKVLKNLKYEIKINFDRKLKLGL